MSSRRMEPAAEQYMDVNVKARCRMPELVEQRIREAGADYLGEDYQTDTFYKVEFGKLKVRKGKIENLITHYQRVTVGDEWHTQVWLYEFNPDTKRIAELTKNRELIGKIAKRRKIFFIANVKFHLDTLEGGESFVEIEAMDRNGDLGRAHLSAQARYYRQLLEIREEDILKSSYIDLISD